jgi:hypothetical protein|tara:strand:- start:175 stop:906 length:732 start_codon:yes stop_codon:yes gene_type:complete
MKKLYYKFTKKYWSILSYEHARKHNFIVQYGIFKNLKMNDKISWGKGDIGSKIYGIYENKIQQKLKDISKPILIDIGAADGFFAIGCLKSKICEYCYAFEETKKSRDNLHLTAKINNVKNNLSIMGEVTKDNFFSSLPSDIDFSKTTILCDIEGGEFDFFTEEILKKVRNSNIIIEIHKNNKKNLEIELLERSKKFFNISIIIDNNKNFENISELHTLNDIDRNLLSSEGRSYIGKWWHLSPK